jgi:hypothetical protein
VSALRQAADDFPTLEAFENGTLDVEAFDHAAHVYIAWRLLQEASLTGAIERFTAALRRITRRYGIEGKYHETISWFYLVLIAERMNAEKEDWARFSGRNPDLLSRAVDLLGKYYSPERLWSPAAKEKFLLPDQIRRSCL